MTVKILVAEDSASDRLIITNMLKGYDVLTANDGLEAMQQLNLHQDIDLIILDLHMPNMDGFQVLSALKSEDRYKKIRTIILTNYDELDNEIKGLDLGAIDFIRKPINMASLRARIDIHAELLRVQQLLEQKLYEQGITFDIIFHQAPIGIAISLGNKPSLDGNNDYISINPMYQQITGRTQEELIRLGWEKITHPDDLGAEIKNFELLKSGSINNYSMDKRYIKPDGSSIWVHVVVAALDLNNDREYNHICFVQDISKRKQIESNLTYNLEHDRWTGLYNQTYLESLLENDLCQPFKANKALVGINLSQLHSINLTYGNYYTRDLIKKIIGALKIHCNDDQLLFSLQDYQFAIYVKAYQDKEELIALCEAVAATLDSLLTIERVEASIGVVEICGSNTSSVDELFKRLLIASEKKLESYGESSYCIFDENMEAEIVRKDELQRELAEIAADESSKLLFLLYQPIYDLKTNQIWGFEALARLNSNLHGQVSPLEFIPLAEESKLIIPLGEKIILQALNFIRKLNGNGHNTPGISINISVIQFLKEGFCEDLLRLIARMDVNPEKICLEITGSVIAKSFEDINIVLRQLKKTGIKIALDDFGTGYSSLARERELSVDYIKIDKTFINKLLVYNPEEAITGDIISMAHKLSHKVIAEGVEEENQKLYLMNSGCDMVQGFLLSKPLAEEQAIELVKKANR